MILVSIVALAALLPSAAGFDVDDVGLSALERSAVVERARAELAVAELIDTPGLAECSADSPDATGAPPSTAHADCVREILTNAGVVAGAAVRVVKVLQVVRVELVIFDRDGNVVATSTRTLDVEGAAKGPLFEDEARLALERVAPRQRKVTPPVPPKPKPDEKGDGDTMPYVAVGAGIAGAVLAIGGGALAANEALLANSPSSSGDEKERARILGPVATTFAALGVVVAVGAPIALGLLSDEESASK